MLLSDGRIARFQSRSLRRKDAPTVTSFLLGFAPFVPHCAKLRRAAMPLAQDDALTILCTDFKIGVTHPNLACKNGDFGERHLAAGGAKRSLAAFSREVSSLPIKPSSL